MAFFWILRQGCVNCYLLTCRNINLPYRVLFHKVLYITFLRNLICIYLLFDFLPYAFQKIVIHEFVSLNWSIWSLLTFYCKFFIFVTAFDWGVNFFNWLLIRLGRSDEIFVVTTISRRHGSLIFLILIKHAGVDSSLFQGINLFSLLNVLVFLCNYLISFRTFVITNFISMWFSFWNFFMRILLY